MAINRNTFWYSISVLIRNYHTINRKISVCLINRVDQVEDLQLKCVSPQDMFQYLLDVSKFREGTCEGFILDMKCLPKKNQCNIEAEAKLDLLNDTFKFTFKSGDIDDFQIKLREEQFCIENLNVSSDIERNNRWSEYVLKPKLLKWAESQKDNISGENKNSSLRLVDAEKYTELYQELKRKYSEKAKKFWSEANESTDPLKFIYEDLAIAAYLIVLWQDKCEHSSVEAFADLGCGNGLLVYILIEEGFRGYGYDVRSRKLWSYYPTKVAQSLYEETINPSSFSLPHDVNWIIGNHSDELSPWIPVLAAVSNYRMNYFLLPCCAFEFSGGKFQRRNSSVSTYSDFIEYVQNISNFCGFETERDRLKIPSTKRTALIGRSRNFTSTMHPFKAEEIKYYVSNEKENHPNTTEDDIKLRNKVEVVRNCTQIDRCILDDIVLKIFRILLCKDKENTPKSQRDVWSLGRSLSMANIAQKLEKEDLKAIKSECGGLKTLLRNKHEIFEISKPDLVKIRMPQIRETSNKPMTTKKRLCFFKENHPQGCPLSNEECTFLH
ncbi:putative tRNA (uracil-O(2)-)-methyltransferase [Haematobia irritans]|uniref:putative tRNA (uracil-O(2)-)-methyltransferase n=1 Tax=Haematobia irritans TaxID=7368 RepID=UPI003F505E9E